jgi:acyl-coenzyme A synthetase/AMP-(fatty) acid ligase
VIPRGEVDGGELIAWVAERVAPHKKLRGVRFVEAIPRTPSGKLLRRLFVEQEQQALMGGPATSEKNVVR